MAARDPEITARNRKIAEMTAQLKTLLTGVLEETGIESELSLHAIYGGKFAEYIDIKTEVIYSPDHFVSLYLTGFKRKAETSPMSTHRTNLKMLLRSSKLQEYLYIFLKRVYLRNYDSLNKKRPEDDEASLWIGQTNANYGILITPKFKAVTQQWTNDHSEIRHFKPGYWTVGHIMETGLVIPGRNRRRTFKDVADYLAFFTDVIVRNSGSPYEEALAEKYSEYVLASDDPLRIPLLIPEFRYGGLDRQHKYRLDFTIIEPVNLSKIGFELSPWSSHGYLSKIKGLTQREVNEMAQDNYEKEMRKHKDFFRKHGVFTLIYTDKDLADLDSVFTDMEKYLRPQNASKQLQFHIIHEILGV